MSTEAQASTANALLIERGEAVLGIELGSTRIKAVLIGSDQQPIATGSYGWENKLVDGIWTYDMEDVWSGIAGCYADLISDVRTRYGVGLTKVAAAGISGMMHGYVALDEHNQLLVPFRTWRNNITGQASRELMELLEYPMPQRWTITHLYQAILNGEEHVPRLARVNTIAGYVHWRLTGSWTIGPGEASGMFSLDTQTVDYDAERVRKFNEHIADRGFGWKLLDLFPEVVPAGEVAGTLTEEGARLLDTGGTLRAGIPLCPPEGDADTGMIATNSIRPKTGNVSAGTSVFGMIVLEKPLSRVHEEIDQLTTPDGKMVAMAHSNNCTSDFNAWMSLFGEAAKALGREVSDDELFATLMPLALQADADGGDMLAYGYVSGEHVTGFSEGRPLFVRKPDSSFTLANFVRTLLFGALGALRTGMNILTEEEKVPVTEIRGHGGFFKTPEVGQRIMAAATKTPVSVLDTAGEGGAWGMALLAAYTARSDRTVSLADWLDEVFQESIGTAVEPRDEDVQGFEEFFKRYTTGLAIEQAAVDTLQ